MRANKVILNLVGVLILAVGLLAACGKPAATRAPDKSEKPTAPPASSGGASLLQERCTTCHSLNRVTQAKKTREGWEQTVKRMIAKGANLNDEERATLIEHLADTYHP